MKCLINNDGRKNKSLSFITLICIHLLIHLTQFTCNASKYHCQSTLGGILRFGKCYKQVFDNSSSENNNGLLLLRYKDAQEYCMTLGYQGIIQVEHREEALFYPDMVSGNDSWTGIRFTGGAWRTRNYELATYLPWGYSEPQNVYMTDTRGGFAVQKNGEANIEWGDEGPDAKRAFACEYVYDHNCHMMSGHLVAGKCIVMLPDKETYERGVELCKGRGFDSLPNIYSNAEKVLLMSTLTDVYGGFTSIWLDHNSVLEQDGSTRDANNTENEVVCEKQWSKTCQSNSTYYYSGKCIGLVTKEDSSDDASFTCETNGFQSPMIARDEIEAGFYEDIAQNRSSNEIACEVTLICDGVCSSRGRCIDPDVCLCDEAQVLGFNCSSREKFVFESNNFPLTNNPQENSSIYTLALDNNGTFYIATHQSIHRYIIYQNMFLYHDSIGGGLEPEGDITNMALIHPSGLLYHESLLFFSDEGSHIIGQVDYQSGSASILAGQYGQPGSVNGVKGINLLTSPRSISIHQDSIYFIDDHSDIRVLNLTSTHVSSLGTLVNATDLAIRKNTLFITTDGGTVVAFDLLLQQFLLYAGNEEEQGGLFRYSTHFSNLSAIAVEPYSDSIIVSTASNAARISTNDKVSYLIGRDSTTGTRYGFTDSIALDSLQAFSSDGMQMYTTEGDSITSVILKCKPGYARPSCLQPICFGLSGDDVNVCNGAGRCVAPDTCECFNKTMNTLNCQGRAKVPLSIVTLNSDNILPSAGIVHPYDPNLILFCNNGTNILQLDRSTTSISIFYEVACRSITVSPDLTSIIITTTNYTIESFHIESSKLMVLAGQPGVPGDVDGDYSMSLIGDVSNVVFNPFESRYAYFAMDGKIKQLDLEWLTIKTVTTGQGSNGVGHVSEVTYMNPSYITFHKDKLIIPDTNANVIYALDMETMKSEILAGTGAVDDYPSAYSVASRSALGQPFQVSVNTLTGDLYIVRKDQGHIQVLNTFGGLYFLSDENGFGLGQLFSNEQFVNIQTTVFDPSSQSLIVFTSSSIMEITFTCEQGLEGSQCMDKVCLNCECERIENSACNSESSLGTKIPVSVHILAGTPNTDLEEPYTNVSAKSAKFGVCEDILIDYTTGHIYLSDTTHSLIHKYDPVEDVVSVFSGKMDQRFPQQGQGNILIEDFTVGYPSGLLCQNECRYIYMVEYFSGTLNCFDLYTGTVENHIAFFDYPRYIVEDNYDSNILYVTERTAVRKIDLRTKQVRLINIMNFATSPLADNLRGLVIDTFQNLYVAQYNPPRINVIDLDTGLISSFLELSDRPVAITLHPQSYELYIATEKDILVYSHQSRRLASIGLRNLSGMEGFDPSPSTIKFSESGELYYFDKNIRVLARIDFGCPSGFTGDDCKEPFCFGKLGREGCSNLGECVNVNTCSCDPGWSGNTCNVFQCFGQNSTDPNVCNGRGSCVAVDTCMCHDPINNAPNCYGQKKVMNTVNTLYESPNKEELFSGIWHPSDGTLIVASELSILQLDVDKGVIKTIPLISQAVYVGAVIDHEGLLLVLDKLNSQLVRVNLTDDTVETYGIDLSLCQPHSIINDKANPHVVYIANTNCNSIVIVDLLRGVTSDYYLGDNIVPYGMSFDSYGNLVITTQVDPNAPVDKVYTLNLKTYKIGTRVFGHNFKLESPLGITRIDRYDGFYVASTDLLSESKSYLTYLHPRFEEGGAIAAQSDPGFVNSFVELSLWNGPFSTLYDSQRSALYVFETKNHAIRRINLVCPNGYTGEKCLTPTCFGIGANDTDVCHGMGRCIAVDNCTCHDPNNPSPSCAGIPKIPKHIEILPFVPVPDDFIVTLDPLDNNVLYFADYAEGSDQISKFNTSSGNMTTFTLAPNRPLTMVWVRYEGDFALLVSYPEVALAYHRLNSSILFELQWAVSSRVIGQHPTDDSLFIYATDYEISTIDIQRNVQTLLLGIGSFFTIRDFLFNYKEQLVVTGDSAISPRALFTEPMTSWIRLFDTSDTETYLEENNLPYGTSLIRNPIDETLLFLTNGSLLTLSSTNLEVLDQFSLNLTEHSRSFLFDSTSNSVILFNSGNITRLTLDCPEGTYGKGCLQKVTSCYDRLNTDPSVCNGHGTCVDLDNCTCTEGYSGSECTRFECWSVDSENPLVCSGHGYCSSPNNCVCNSKYTGDLCQFSICQDILKNCSGFGMCNLNSSTCECISGASGAYCSDVNCDGVSDCSNHGECIGPNTCKCDSGYTSKSCNDFACYGVPRANQQVCSGRGNCTAPNTCKCDIDFEGLNCESSPGNFDIYANYSSVIGSCSPFQATTAAKSKLNGVDIIASFSWTLTSPQNILLSAYLMTQTNSTITIPHSLLSPGSEFVLLLTAVPTTGLPLRKTLAFTKTAHMVSAKIDAPQVQTITMRRSQVNVLNSLITVPSCILLSNIKFSWTIRNEFNSLPSQSTRSLVLAKNSFPVGGYYTITMTAQLEEKIYSDEVKVIVITDPPVIKIKGGSVAIQANYSYTIDASQSYDPEYPLAQKFFVWSCKELSDGAVCPKYGDIAPTSILTFTSGVIGKYNVSVEMQTQVSRSANGYVVIEVISENIPRVSIVTSLPNIISASKRLALEAKIDPVTDLTRITLSWAITELLSNGQESPLVLNKTNLLTDSSTSRNLVLKEGTLKPGRTYALRIYAQYRGSSKYAFSSIIATTSLAPFYSNSLTALQVSPSSGASTTTLFTLTAKDWIADSNSLPLKYSFEYLDSKTGLWRVIAPFDLSNSFETRVITQSNSDRVLIACKVRNYFEEEAVVYANVTVQHTDITTSAIKGILDAKRQDILGSNGTLSRDVGFVLMQLTDLYSQTSDISPELVDGLMELIELGADNLTPDFVSQQMNALENLSGKSSSFEAQQKSRLISITDQILTTSNSSDPISTDRISNSAGQAISNIILSPPTTDQDELNDQALNTIRSLTSYILTGMIPGENPISIETNAFVASVQKDFARSLANRTISVTGSASVFLPNSDTIPSDDEETEYAVEFFTYPDADSILWQSKSNNISSNIVSFRVLDSSGNKIPFIAENDHPLVITLSKPIGQNLDSQNVEYVCKYYDETRETEWGTMGCWLFSETNASIVCHCNHTTSFAVFIQYSRSDLAKPIATVERAVYYVAIAIHGWFMIIIAALIIFILYHRNKQPIRSRIYAPIICLVAIFVECALQGILRNGLLAAKSREKLTIAINVIGYIIVTIACPLSITSLFAYLWQNLRYFMLKNMYYLMDKRNGKGGSQMLITYRILVSKLGFFLACGVVLLLSFVYFLVLSIIGGVLSPNSSKSAEALTITSSVSYLGVLILIGIAIIATFVWDVLIIPHRQRQHAKRSGKATNSHETRQNEVEVIDFTQLTQNLKEKKGTIAQILPETLLSQLRLHFKKNDPLHFRIDSILIVVAILFGFVSFGIGIAAEYVPMRDDSAVRVVWLIFDLLYTALRIMAFGGGIAIIQLVFIYKGKSSSPFKIAARIESDSSIEETIKHTTHSPLGRKLFREYCIKEMALENLLLFMELEVLLKEWSSMDNSQKQNKLQSICDNYIQTPSENEVNLPGAIKKDIVKMKADFSQRELTAQLQSLTKLNNAILTNLSDTFSRYVDSEEYIQFMNINKMQQRLEDMNLSGVDIIDQ